MALSASEVVQNLRVWVSIGRGEDAPRTPGIITDARVGPRTVIRSEGKGGPLNLAQSVVVITFRKPLVNSVDPTTHEARPATFYVERPEALVGLSLRDEHIPAVDGPKDADRGSVIAALRKRVRESQDAITPGPSAKAIADAVALYSKEEALTV